MPLNARMIGAGVAAAVAAGIGYMLLSREEEAAFDMVAREGAFSVRDYPPLLVAETVVPGLRDAALSVGFTRLADYVSGRGHVPATAPVLADGDEDGRGWRTRILMPAAARDLLPDPGADVLLRSLPPRRLAALRFTGERDEGAFDARERELRAWIDRRSFRTAGPVEHAFFGSPLMPAPLRRAEVLIPLAA